MQLEREGLMAVSTQRLYMCTQLIHNHIDIHTQTHTHTQNHIQVQTYRISAIKGSSSRDPQMHMMCTGLFVSVYDNKSDLRVKYTAGLHESQIQEPDIVFFHCLSYPNGDGGNA